MHIEGKNVHVDQKIKENVKKVSLLVMSNPKKVTQKCSIQL